MKNQRTSGSVTKPGTASVAPATRSSAAEVDEFLARVTSLAPSTAAGRGRLIFAMDATMSRQPTWDLALTLQGAMFDAVRDTGSLDVQLAYFRGRDECRASRWVADPAALGALMTQVACRGGYTQIARILAHAIAEASAGRVHALVYVGDCMEEDIDALCARAGELSLLGCPMFLFQEGHNATASVAFRELARLTGGAYCRFDAGSAAQLRDLLASVAVYAAGGRKALEHRGRTDPSARMLLEHLSAGGSR